MNFRVSLEEGGKSSDILLFRELCIFMVSLVNFISRELEEFLVARVNTTRNAKADFGLVTLQKKVCWEEGPADLPGICDDCWVDVRELGQPWEDTIEVKDETT